MRDAKRRAVPLFLKIAAILAALVLLGFFDGWTKNIVVAYEKAALGIAPSGERADLYGARHFSSGSPWLYDINATSYFYRRLASLDPHHPHLYHQLARIEFLKDNLISAHVYINKQIDDFGETVPDSYYVRGLIRGYLGLYEDAVHDYTRYLALIEHDTWAAINDYAWVLLKTDKFIEAVHATEDGLKRATGNPWLLNTSAVAYYELGDYKKALERAALALEGAKSLTEREWLMAYPGNDPRAAKQGIETLKGAAVANMHRAKVKLEEEKLQ